MFKSLPSFQEKNEIVSLQQLRWVDSSYVFQPLDLQVEGLDVWIFFLVNGKGPRQLVEFLRGAQHGDAQGKWNDFIQQLYGCS